MNERDMELAEQQVGSILMDLVMPDVGKPERIKWNIGCTREHLKKFAALIRADEREACAKLCDEARAARLAEQIRARGNT